MRNRLLIAVLILAGLLVFLWWGLQRPVNRASYNTETSAVRLQNGSAPSPTVASAGSLSKPALSATYEALIERWKSDFKTPINFYGKVVDQHGEPVADADVKMSANDKAGGGKPTEYARKTDTSGTFSITGIGGLTLAVEVSKTGFRYVPPSDGKAGSSGLFEYGVSSRGPYQSSKDSPTIFVLYKPGHMEPLVKIGEKNFRMARDGTPLSVAVDEQARHQVILRCWNQELQRPPSQRQYDWRLEITVQDGGLAPRKDAFDFVAPESGYEPAETIDMPSSLGNQWHSSAERSYFIRFADGTFARVNLRMRAMGDHFVVWESYFNPKAGSRNLENGASAPQNP